MKAAPDAKEKELIDIFLKEAVSLVGHCFNILSVRRSLALGPGIYVNLASSDDKPLSDEKCSVLYKLGTQLSNRHKYYVEILVDEEEEGGEMLDLEFAQETISQKAAADIHKMAGNFMSSALGSEVTPETGGSDSTTHTRASSKEKRADQ